MTGAFFVFCIIQRNMIKGKVKLDLDAETILKFVSEFDIFHFYMPRKWKLNEVTNSPLHKDENPSFLIGNRNGYLSFIDFSMNVHGNCFDFVKLLYNCSYNEALKIIDRDFGLGICGDTNAGAYKKIVEEYKQPEEDKEKHSVMIQVITKKFTKEELQYWREYHLDIQDLKDSHIYSIGKVFLNRRRFSTKDDELKFGYLYEDKWKLYFPKRDKKRKWLSNVPLSMAGGLSNLDKDHNALICKSLKDQLVCRKIYPYVCHVQNESLAAFSFDTIEYIRANSKEVFYGGDSDAPGKSASYIITNTLKWKHINPPDRLLPDIKDFSDWAKVEGLEKVEEHFKKKGLII